MGARKTRFIWRLERDGKGAFKSDLVDDACWPDMPNRYLPRRCPAPRAEPALQALMKPDAMTLFGDSFPEDYYFGFSSLRQYRRWFNSRRLRTNLAAQNGVLFKYSVPAEHVVDAEWQCVFRKQYATTIESRRPDRC